MAKLASTDLQGLYEGDDYTSRYHDKAGHRITRLLDHIDFKPGDKILDIGCGNGLLLPEIIAKIKHYDGVDFSRTFIEEAIKRAASQKINSQKYRFHKGDIISFCRRNNGYDKVFALDFTEHINDEELRNTFRFVKKSMKPKSQLIIHTPNKDFVLERLKSDEIKFKKQGHIGLRNAEEYKMMLKHLGYKKVKATPLSHYISILKPLHIFSYVPIKKLSTLFQARLLIICEA